MKTLLTRAATAVASTTILAGGLVATAPSAQAAAGVVGRLDSVSATASESCHGPRNEYNCLDYTNLHTYGWALNKQTAPAQSVRFTVTGNLYSFDMTYHTRSTWTSGAYTANACRNDVKKAYGLKSCAVGYDVRPRISLVGHYVGTITVCAQARDAGTSQGWRAIGTCKSTTITK